MSPNLQGPRTTLPPPVVLLIEDHADSRALYAFDLRSSGFRVEEATNTTEAIQAVAATVPDVVVADLHLPDADGVRLCRTLKESALTRDVPIIAVTASANADTARAARDAGCVAVLVKPCLPADVRAEIERVLTSSRHVRQRSATALERAHALARKSAVLKVKPERVQSRLTTYVEDAHLVQTLARVRSEFVEMPGLHLTDAQAARLLGLDRAAAGRLLDRLVAEGFLRKTPSQMYLRAV
jgi:CheY-like chemotaxis protein